MKDSERFFDRDLSWLAFDRRVLEEARNEAHPALERLRFLSISARNLDEFFMVRLAGLKAQQLAEQSEPSGKAGSLSEQLEEIAGEAERLSCDQQQAWAELRVELSRAGVAVLGEEELDPEAGEWLAAYFLKEIFPVLTPQAIDPVHPFPFIPNKGIALILEFDRPSDGAHARELLMLPSSLPRFIRIPGETAQYVAIENVVRRHLSELFPGYKLLAHGAFRIIRDSDVDVEEEGQELVPFFQKAMKRRRRGRVVKLELESGMPDRLSEVARLGLSAADAVMSEVPGLLGLDGLERVVDEDWPDLKFPSYAPRFPEPIAEHRGDYFAAIRASDILVHHPYETFEVVVEFLKQAAADPDVIAIKQTIYRAGKQSAIIRALIDAAEAGKSVTVVIELKARFDEEQNLFWGKALEEAGAQVVYGFIKYKTHAKAAMVVRREPDGHRTYCHLGTGNYNPVSARVYTDLSFFTADPRAGRDVAQLFDYITAYIEPHGLETLTLAPLGLRQELVKLIDAEIANARLGRPAAIWAKLNALVDKPLIEKLYEASAAGVQIDLVVRGICCLRPGVPELSENIRVKSIVGRFLEHGRSWAFANGEQLPGGNALLFISSADWMPRNLDRRVEYMLRIENPAARAQILDQVLLANLCDNEQSWRLLAAGRYERIEPKPDDRFNVHSYFMAHPSLSGPPASKQRAEPLPPVAHRLVADVDPPLE
ncbi:MAG TPA: RNA degradosome polyphosphate kinase [Allosphingosinicella sp.]|nr:RNA degradosome polyphosphate kinase [Allosphingosinicella sp.]